MSQTTYVAALVACLLYGWLFNAWTAVIAALAGAMLSVGLADAAKDIIARSRPPAHLALVPTNGYAMPSSIAAMTLGAALPIIVSGLRSGVRAGRLPAAALTAAVFGTGVSMVYLGAHWVSDVLAGWVLGGLVGAGVLAALTALARRISRVARCRTDALITYSLPVKSPTKKRTHGRSRRGSS